jgi:hypothetical protein
MCEVKLMLRTERLLRSRVLCGFFTTLVTGAAAGPAAPPADPPNPADLPPFWKSTLSDVEAAVKNVRAGTVTRVAESPGGLPVYAVAYGRKDDLRSQANYNSAVAARNPAYYAVKDQTMKPVVFFIGPVHGQEIENIVGLVNLIRVAETGRDHRGRPWPELKAALEACRVIIVPCANPDGRRRCPYDSFVGLPTRTMTKYGQGTRRDRSFWGWPGAKALHPMQGDVGILGAYFNDDGINPMHDDFFKPMARETAAVLEIARTEAPDLAVSLHSHESPPVVLQASFVPVFVRKRIQELSLRVKTRFERKGLPYGSVLKPRVDDETPPPRAYFNLIGALHHVSGATAFTFECSHGSVSERRPEPIVTHDQILDVQLCLYEEMLAYARENRIYWER